MYSYPGRRFLKFAQSVTFVKIRDSDKKEIAIVKEKNEPMNYLICIRKMIVFGLFSLLVLGCKQEQQTPESQPNPNTKPITEQLSKTVSASQLMTDYVNDPYNADLTYMEAPFIVTGSINSIAPIESKLYIKQFEYLIRLDSGKVNDSHTFVMCEFHRSQGDSLRHLQEGDMVKISGVIQTDKHKDLLGNTRLGGLREAEVFIYKDGKIKHFPLEKDVPKDRDFRGIKIIGPAYYVIMDGCKLVK